MFTLPELPYGLGDLAPWISEETLSFHYGKHHQAYVNALNGLLEAEENAAYKGMRLEDIVKKADGAVFNNAAQIWNHTFYWNSMRKPKENATLESSEMGSHMQSLLSSSSFKDIYGLRESFVKSAVGCFGSGWCWLVLKNGTLDICKTSNAGTPLRDKELGTPLLVCDVWEHAYYIDFRNRRVDYVHKFFDYLANWEWAEGQLGNRS